MWSLMSALKSVHMASGEHIPRSKERETGLSSQWLRINFPASRKCARAEACDPHRFVKLLFGGRGRFQPSQPENPTVRRRARATSSPSPATAKTRSDPGTRNDHGFLTQKQKFPIRLIQPGRSAIRSRASKRVTFESNCYEQVY